MLIQKISLSHLSDEMVSIESSKDIPFDIKRIYYIFNATDTRGKHAHINLKQMLVCISGSCTVKLDTGHETQTILLNNPTEGILVEGLVWREMFDFTPGAVLLVFANELYDEADYIRDYEEFLTLAN